DHMVRRVFLTDQHSEHVTPSWFGESIGHYENGDALVVDTVGLSTKNSYVDNFRTPHTERLHVVERFTIDPDGKNMTAIVTVHDPDTFNEPLTMQQRWFKVNAPMRETICAENNRDYFNQGLFPVPEADKSDFGESCRGVRFPEFNFSHPRHSGAPQRSGGEPGIHNPRTVVMDSGLSACGRAPE